MMDDILRDEVPQPFLSHDHIPPIGKKFHIKMFDSPKLSQIGEDIICHDKPDVEGAIYQCSIMFTREWNYFEVEVLDTMDQSCSLGVARDLYDYAPGEATHRCPGLVRNSVALRLDTGTIKGCRAEDVERAVKGDRYGVGVTFDDGHVTIFFTRRGVKCASIPRFSKASYELYPTVCMHKCGSKLRILPNRYYNPGWSEDPRLAPSTVTEDNQTLMTVDSIDDDWCFENVQSNGIVFGYVGSARQVGMAQFKHALTPEWHYFQVRISDTGESGFIGVGVCHRNYPSHLFPGWGKGSVAFHVDSGELYSGSRLGEQFGSACKRDDVLGCGILFPPDYDHDRHHSSGGATVGGGRGRGGRDGPVKDRRRRIAAAAGKEKAIRKHFGLNDDDDADHNDDDDFGDDDDDDDRFFEEHFQPEQRPAVAAGHGGKVRYLRAELLVRRGDNQRLKRHRQQMAQRYPRWFYGQHNDSPLALPSSCGENSCDFTKTTVEVFFTLNGALIGMHSAQLPVGGFFPCIGFLSFGEKVTVDMYPMTG